jgi:hypothetical protein
MSVSLELRFAAPGMGAFRTESWQASARAMPRKISETSSRDPR